MIHVVTGGSGSGKSEYAELLVTETGIYPRIYLATMMVWDEEGRERVRHHQKMRKGKGFLTLECFHEIKKLRLQEAFGGMEQRDCLQTKRSVLLLECMSNLVSNEYYRLGKQAADEIIQGIESLKGQCEQLVIVTNEVFSDGMAYDYETRGYIEILSQINRYLYRMSDTMTEVVYGIPIKIK